MSSVLLGSSTPEQLIENLGAIQASATALSDKLRGSHGVGEDVPGHCPVSPPLSFMSQLPSYMEVPNRLLIPRLGGVGGQRYKR